MIQFHPTHVLPSSYYRFHIIPHLQASQLSLRYRYLIRLLAECNSLHITVYLTTPTSECDARHADQ